VLYLCKKNCIFCQFVGRECKIYKTALASPDLTVSSSIFSFPIFLSISNYSNIGTFEKIIDDNNQINDFHWMQRNNNLTHNDLIMVQIVQSNIIINNSRMILRYYH
jgi:hypothetical protein